MVSGVYLRDHPDVVEHVLKGLLEAQAFISFPANRNIVLQTMMQQMKLNDPVILEEGYQDLLVGFERKPYGTAEGLRNIQRMMGSLNPKVSRSRSTISSIIALFANSTRSALSTGLYANR